MSVRGLAGCVSLALAIGLAGCGAPNQPQGAAPPAPTPEEKAKLKSDPSEKVGAPLSGKTAKRAPSR
jgi:hypothetical protein